MVLKLYGNLNATCTKRVRTVLAELDVPYEFISIDLAKGEQKTPEYLALQPFGQVPYLDDDGFGLFESRAIARYLGLKYGGVGTLIPEPTDVQKTALFEQAASIEMSDFEPSAVGLAIENLFKPYAFSLVSQMDSQAHCVGDDRMYGKPTDTATVERLKATLEGKMAGYEAILSKTQFLAGNVRTWGLRSQAQNHVTDGRHQEITLADLFHLPCGSLLEQQGIDYLVSDRWPNVAR
ncbi:Glutathione S-transferase [Trametes pubescens]|uniref:glutathione transferase n=1 Tax=Trametes pubescens TaxID=154538 RepID=A0A1M2VLU5_TRAPU|nr:Glutathione S-transferase [Trametes pubescens]